MNLLIAEIKNFSVARSRYGAGGVDPDFGPSLSLSWQISQVKLPMRMRCMSSTQACFAAEVRERPRGVGRAAFGVLTNVLQGARSMQSMATVRTSR
jgi:hypothetical protein